MYMERKHIKTDHKTFLKGVATGFTPFNILEAAIGA